MQQYPNLTTLLENYANKPSGISTDDHINKWIGQFNINYQIPILDVLEELITNNAYSDKKFEDIFGSKIISDASLTRKDPSKYWAETFILRCPQNRSQNEIASILCSSLNAKGLPFCTDETKAVRYLYIDDFSFSGYRIYQDLKDFNTDKEIDIVTIATYEYNKYSFEKKFKPKLKFKEINRFNHIVFENRLWKKEDAETFIPHTDCLEEFFIKFHDNLNGKTFSKFMRTTHKPNRTFSNPQKRFLCEKAFFEKGLFITESCSTRYKPLGGQAPYGLGFGSALFTYRNCSNTNPLVLWFGDYDGKIWYPLIKRNGY